MSTRPEAQAPALVLLCQDCGGDLTVTKRKIPIVGGEVPVWICTQCRAPWVWTSNGWMRQDY